MLEGAWDTTAVPLPWDFYDPSGNFQFEVPGSVTGECISVE